MAQKTNGQGTREKLLAELKQPEITPEAIEADRIARCEAAKKEFHELQQRHRVVFEPVFVIRHNGIQRDFEILPLP